MIERAFIQEEGMGRLGLEERLVHDELVRHRALGAVDLSRSLRPPKEREKRMRGYIAAKEIRMGRKGKRAVRKPRVKRSWDVREALQALPFEERLGTLHHFNHGRIV